jgi:membrane protein YqaA with SNARE-associated domain
MLENLVFYWESLSNYLEIFVLNYGFWGLFWFAYFEAFLQPFPVDPFISGSVFLGMTKAEVLLSSSLGTMLGAVTGYFCGVFLGKKFFLKIFPKKFWIKGSKMFEKYGILAIFLASISPIPYKVFAWLAGIFRMNFLSFFLTTAVGRIGRFLFVAYLSDYIFKLFQ